MNKYNSAIAMHMELRSELTKIAGIGPAKAKELVDFGVNRLDDLKKPHFFNILPKEAQLEVTYNIDRQLPLKFVDGFMQRVIAETNPSIIKVPFVGVGSYRRKVKILRDLDILTNVPLRESGAEFERICAVIGAEVLSKYVDGFVRRSYIVKYDGRTFKIDLFYTHPATYAAALLHWTGSVMWNIRCRAQAKRKGYKLNEKGLWRYGQLMDTKTEEEILNIIDISYKKPEEREEGGKVDRFFKIHPPEPDPDEKEPPLTLRVRHPKRGTAVPLKPHAPLANQ